MTMPHKRTRSIRWGHELLGEMLGDPSVDEAIKAAARTLLMTYPSPAAVSQWIDDHAAAIAPAAAQAIVEGADLWARLRRSGQGSDKTRRSLVFAERHFPEPWMAQMLATNPIDGIRGWLMQEDHRAEPKIR